MSRTSKATQVSDSYKVLAAAILADAAKQAQRGDLVSQFWLLAEGWDYAEFVGLDLKAILRFIEDVTACQPKTTN